MGSRCGGAPAPPRGLAHQQAHQLALWRDPGIWLGGHAHTGPRWCKQSSEASGFGGSPLAPPRPWLGAQWPALTLGVPEPLSRQARPAEAQGASWGAAKGGHFDHGEEAQGASWGTAKGGHFDHGEEAQGASWGAAKGGHFDHDAAQPRWLETWQARGVVVRL